MNIVNITLGVDTQPCSSITLGRRGENEVTQVVVDFSSWVEEFGAGVITLLAMRSQDTSAYPVVLTLDGNTATWDVTSTDTAYKGSGRAEYIYTVGEQIAKSVVFNTVVMQDIGEPSETPPDPYEDWLERLTELGAETQANAEAAQQSAEDAEQSAQEAAQESANAEGYAEQAGESASAAQSAEDASESARDAAQVAQASAESSATAASGSATSAAGSATAAAGSASDASASASAAGASATTASTAAGQAESAKTAAQAAQSAAEDAAEDAQQAAQQAHVEYEQLSGEVDDLTDEVSQQKSAIDNVEASLATVETTSTASRAYSVGELLVYGNRLYRVASVIAAGATLTPNTNITPTTVEGELADISAAIPTDPVSPSMALTKKTYIQNGEYTFSNLRIFLKNGTIEISNNSVTPSYKLIWFSGAFNNYTGGVASAIPEAESCLDISLLSGSDVVKTYASSRLNGVAVGITFVKISENVVTLTGRLGFGFITSSGLFTYPMQIPTGTTHFSLYVYRGASSEIGSTEFSIEFDKLSTT